MGLYKKTICICNCLCVAVPSAQMSPVNIEKQLCRHDTGTTNKSKIAATSPVLRALPLETDDDDDYYYYH